jgi:transposase-like protein
LTDQPVFLYSLSMETPKTLQQAIVYFDKVENCNAFMMAARWADGQVRCPTCDSQDVIYLENARLFKCRAKHPRQKFSLKVGTIFEDSALGLSKWLTAIWLIANAKNGISSCELARSVGVTQKSAWHMNHRIRLAMQNGSLNNLTGNVEVDETFIGGLARNMHASKRHKLSRNGIIGKVAVMGLLERHGGEVRTLVLKGLTQESLQPKVRAHVEQDS